MAQRSRGIAGTPRPKARNNKPEQDEREDLLRRAAPQVLAAVELGWMPPCFASAGIRLEYLRLLNDLEPGTWAKQAGVGGSTLGNWRAEGELDIQWGDTDRKTRSYIARLIAKLPASAELAWVLWGSAPANATTLAARTQVALEAWEGLISTVAIGHHEIRQKLGIPSGDVFKEGAPTDAQQAAIATLAKACSPWCSEAWLRDGQAAPPAQLQCLMQAMQKSSPTRPAWADRAREQVIIWQRQLTPCTMTRGEALQQMAIISRCEGLHHHLRDAILAVLTEADIAGLTCGEKTLKPMTVLEFLEVAPALLKAGPPGIRQQKVARPVLPDRMKRDGKIRHK